MARSAFMIRSATCPAMNGAVTAPIDPARPRIQPICVPVNPSPPPETGVPRYMARIGSHSPQTAYWRNIMIDSRTPVAAGERCGVALFKTSASSELERLVMFRVQS